MQGALSGDRWWQLFTGDAMGRTTAAHLSSSPKSWLLDQPGTQDTKGHFNAVAER
jgi:hypothetical protein